MAYVILGQLTTVIFSYTQTYLKEITGRAVIPVTIVTLIESYGA